MPKPPPSPPVDNISRQAAGAVSEQEALLEFRQIGSIMRVSVIDPATNTEVVIQGPANVGRAALARNALNKLNYMLAKKKGGV
jgi:hypothetical protein